MAITAIRTLIIYIFIICAVRIMGKRQVGELKPHELVITILVSSVASIPLESNSMPLSNSLLPIMLLVSFEIIVSIISMKSLAFRNLLQGRPTFLIRKGKLDQKKLSAVRLTVDDVIDALRQKNVFDISKVEDAVLETNGSVSVLLKAQNSPLTPQDVLLNPTENGMPITLVIDGKIVEEYFSKYKVKKSEIKLILQAENVQAKELMILTLDDNGNVYSVKKENK